LNTAYSTFAAWVTVVQSSGSENRPFWGLQGSNCWCPAWEEEQSDIPLTEKRLKDPEDKVEKNPVQRNEKE